MKEDTNDGNNLLPLVTSLFKAFVYPKRHSAFGHSSKQKNEKIMNDSDSYVKSVKR